MKPPIKAEHYDPHQLPAWPVLVGFAIWCAVVAGVVFGLTAYTFQLDDIKIPVLMAGGALCLVIWCVLWAMGLVRVPGRVAIGCLLAYLAICVVSTLAAAPFARWVGWEMMAFNVGALGLVLLGGGVLTTRKMVELAFKFWTVIALLTTTFGLIHYAGLLEPFYKVVWPAGPPRTEDRFHDLVYTFMVNRSMLSTILNVQFFGVFLLMVMPVVASTLVIAFQNLRRRLEEGAPITRPLFWSITCGLTLVFCVTCIFTTYSKSAIVFLPMMLIGFVGGIYFFTSIRRIPHLGMMSVLGVVMAATVISFTQADIRAQFKDVEESLGPRRLIWGGAVAIFQEHPVLGGGPGSFRLLFPAHRDPDYHLNRVSNVTLYAHNWVLDLLCETGVLGALAYLAFLGAGGWMAWRALRRSEDMVLRICVLGTVVGLASILAGALLNPMTRWPVGIGSLHAMLGTALGVASFALSPASPVGKRRTGPAPADAITPEQRNMRYALAAAAFVAFVVTTHYGTSYFRASVLHNEGMRRSELRPNIYSASGVVKPEFLPVVREAAEFFERSLAIRPGSLTTYYKLAHVYNQLGQLDKALETYKRLQAYGPDYSEVHFNIAVMNFNLGDAARRQMLALVEAAQRGEPAPEGVDRQAEVDRLGAEMLSRIEASIVAFTRAAEMSNKVSVQFFLANAHQFYAQLLPAGDERAPGHFRKAAKVFERVADLPVSTVIQEVGQANKEREQQFLALQAARDSWISAGEPLRAAALSERLYRENPNMRTELDRAVSLYIQGGSPDKALALVDEILARNPLSPAVHLLRVSALRQAGRNEEHRAAVASLLRLDERLRADGVDFLAPAQRQSLSAESSG
jgi:tetratricopeptide (TPR) repeat protein